MISSPYYHAIIKKYIILFGTLFSGIYIQRFDEDSDVLQKIQVPIQYGNREKFMARVEARDPVTKEPPMQLPRMGFEYTDITYDANRQLPISNRIMNFKDGSVISTYNPVPYNIGFRLLIITKYAEDAYKIVEQILPNFAPQLTVSAKLIETMPDYSIDIPVVLNNVDFSDNYDSHYENRRTIIWELNFTLKGYFYGPVSNPKIITIADTNFYIGDPSANNSYVLKEKIVAGITSNGQPTTNVELIPGYDANTYINPIIEQDEGSEYPYFVFIDDKVK